ncbi:MAG: hypothetical protein QNK23_12165 [Crocinitomicaceae bacterium]|nr:hypothetical protein [Crocinitomicaceae bacterium]
MEEEEFDDNELIETEEKSTDSKDNSATKFQSPVPFLRQFRNLIFGKRTPDMFTRITFYINSVLWTTFIIWHILSYATLTSRDLFMQQKGLPIEAIVEARGAELGFESGEFLSRLITYHAISVICWIVMFVGLIFLYRKLKTFVYLILGATVFYIGMSIFYIGFRYFMEDTTAYDKVALLIIIVSTLLHSYLLKNGRDEDGHVSFFGLGSRED